MNFKIKHKPYQDWNRTLIELYINTPRFINWIFWFLEQLRTPKNYYNWLTGDNDLTI